MSQVHQVSREQQVLPWPAVRQAVAAPAPVWLLTRSRRLAFCAVEADFAAWACSGFGAGHGNLPSRGGTGSGEAAALISPAPVVVLWPSCRAGSERAGCGRVGCPGKAAAALSVAGAGFEVGTVAGAGAPSGRACSDGPLERAVVCPAEIVLSSGRLSCMAGAGAAGSAVGLRAATACGAAAGVAATPVGLISPPLGAGAR